MSFNTIIMWIMAVGAIVGGLDRLFGNKFGLGEKFEEGFNAMGPLALGMVGIVCLSSSRSEERRVGKECRSRWSPYH